MKTKDFIKMLQDVDPTGEHHIRLDGGFPSFAELVKGYHDGGYSYIDDDGDFIVSNEDFKVDIHSMNIDEFIEKYFDEKDPDNWEKIKSKIRFKFDNYANDDQRKKAEDNFLIFAKSVLEEWNDTVRWSKEFEN